MKEIEIKRNMNEMVEYKGNMDTYMLTGCILRREINKGPFWYQAELTDIKADCLLYVELKDIHAITEVTE